MKTRIIQIGNSGNILVNDAQTPQRTFEEKPKLLEQLRQAIRTRHYSPRTEQAYVHWIKRFILFHKKRHPSEMGEKEISNFLNHLAVKCNVSASTQNQALCAIVFLYKQVLRQDIGPLGELVWAKKPIKLPVVLTREEVKRDRKS